MKALKCALAAIALIAVTSCGDRDPSFSLLQETDVFYQSTSSFSNKLDILWVVDNSGSMLNLQTNIANNFNAFISDFAAKGYDFQIAVTTTDAWLADPAYTGQGYGQSSYSDYKGTTQIILPSTPNLETEFINNIMQGTSGYGDERAFQSMEQALTNSANQLLGFPRADGFLAVIIISDEDDFSKDPFVYTGESYTNPDLHTVASYESFLDSLTQSTGPQRQYSVSSVSILDSTCLAANDPWGNIAQRYHSLVTATNGVNGDVCSSDFATTLSDIAQNIAELSTQFFLSREPIVSSIEVKVNDVTVPEDPVNGWTYNPTAVSIVFHGTAVPAQGAKIEIDFDPVTVVQ